MRWQIQSAIQLLHLSPYFRSIYDVCKQATDVVDILEERIEKKVVQNTLPEDVSSEFESLKDIDSVIY